MTHSKEEAEEWAKSSIRLASGPADDLISGTIASLVRDVRGNRWSIAIAMITTFLAICVWDLPVGFPARLLLEGLYCIVAGRILTKDMVDRTQRLVFLTVTQDELICYRMPKMSQQAAMASVLFRASPSDVRVKGRKGKSDRYWAISLASRGLGGKGRPWHRRIRAWLELRVQVLVYRPWYRELGEIMTALQASRAQVQPALLDITAELTAAESLGAADFSVRDGNWDALRR